MKNPDGQIVSFHKITETKRILICHYAVNLLKSQNHFLAISFPKILAAKCLILVVAMVYPHTPEQFYDSISKDYSDFVTRCVPWYKEMLSILFAYLPSKYSPQSILELGCGTGNLTHLLFKHFPQSQIQAVDISEECIKECKRRLPSASIQYIKLDFRDLDFPANSFDFIISSIAIHHLDDKEKEEIFKKLFSWQAPKGILTFCDQFRGETDHLYEHHMETWKAFAFNQGATDKEWNTWMEHQTQHDHHASLLEHMNWLRNAGYSIVDCTWRYLLWAAIYAEKA